MTTDEEPAMATASIFNLLKERPVLFDGGLGTELMKRGLPQGTCPELWNITNPETVKEVHKGYFDAGSDAVATNSFGGSRIKLASFGLEARSHELNYAAARLAGEVKPKGKYVAGSMGPTGKFLKPQGEYEEAEFESAFAGQAKALAMGKVDFLLIETMFDLREALCALRGAKSAVHIPVMLTMTFNRTPRGFFTLMGNSVAQCVAVLEKEGVSALGANCTLSSSDMADCIREIHGLTRLPIIAKPNAGQPEFNAAREVVYSRSVEDFVRDVPKMLENGASVVGGCCGTDSAYIRRIADLLKK
jgi:5-methyltetrahydrofolate--homocysteine methyltransferase